MPRRSSRFAADRGFPPYVPAASRARLAAAAVAKLKGKGHAIEPVQIAGKAIASTFWGKAWCRHLESLSDFESRLPRGRSYVRHGAVVHLALDSGRIRAKVQGSSLYDIEIGIVKLRAQRWAKVVAECSGSIDSLIELLRGKLSESVMHVVTNAETGLFPGAHEIRMSCSCPDWADLCKHLAAVLYGVGARLDARPELLFSLRGVDPNELIAEGAAATASEAKARGKASRRTLSNDALADVFGIELELGTRARVQAEPVSARPGRTERVPPNTARKLGKPKRAAALERPAAAPEQRAVVPKQRSASDVAENTARVLWFIESHPGLSVELISQGTKLSYAQLSLPLRKLTATGGVVTVGERRETRYFPASLSRRRRQVRS